MSVESTQIRYEVRDAVAVITLDRPERLSAWTPVTATEAVAAFLEKRPAPFRRTP